LSVRAVRGAVTVDNNSSEDVMNETIKLLSRMIDDNVINKDDIISIIFSTTHDINAAFPAAAARKMGWTDIPLMCTNEMDVPGSLPKCIRILMHINSDKTNAQLRHIYMKDARKLRPDLT